MHGLKITFSEGANPKLSKPEGDFICALIQNHTGMSLSDYSVKIDMDRSLLSRYLNGHLNITREALNRILSGIEYEKDGIHYQYSAEWSTQVTIRSINSSSIPPS